MYSKFMELVKEKDAAELRKFVERADAKDLCEMVKSKICHQDTGPTMLINLLANFTETAAAQSKRRKVVETALTALHKANVSISHVNTIVSRIIPDFPQYSTVHLVKLVEFCQASIQNNDDDFMSWKDLLPQLMEVLQERKNIDYNDEVSAGDAYKGTVIRSLCNGHWDPGILSSLATMFREMTLTKEEHLIVVKALCKRISVMEPNEVPPVAHELLTLCRHQNGGLLMVALCKYFKKYYAKALDCDSQELSEQIGAISSRDIQQVESTVLYHILQAAQLSHSSIKEFLRSLKIVTCTPEYVLDPFIMSVLLSVSSIYEDQVFEILRTVISRQIHDEEKRKHSAWLRMVLPENDKVMEVLKLVMDNSLKDRPTILKGMVDLAFVLMGVGGKLGDEAQTAALWNIGTKILQRLVHKRNDTGSTILQILTDKMLTGGTAISQYTECLEYMCRKLPIVMLNCKVWIIILLEQLVAIPSSAARQVTYAVLPLACHSQSVRDGLIMILRKALYNKEAHRRQMAVACFLQLLKTMKISTMGMLSQSAHSSSTTSATSVCTQVSVEARTTAKAAESNANPKHNTLLCHEILTILKRCFTHQVDVRLQLYEGLYDTILMNPELSKYVVDMLLNHFKQYWEPTEDTLPPLKLDKCTTIRGPESILQEPIGDLIFAMQRVYVHAASGESAGLNKLSVILESLCKRMAKSELEHFELDDGIDLLDNVPDSQQKLHNLKLLMMVYEALIAYRIAAWTPETRNAAQNIYSLFEGYNRLVERSKTANKPKKGEAKKKKDKDVTDATLNKKASRPVPFKQPSTIMDLNTVSRVLCLLYSETVPWTSREQSSSLRKRSQFHRYILQCCLQLIQRAKQLKHIELQRHKDQYGSKYLDIGSVLYQKIVSELDEIQNFDQQTALLAVECLKELCDLMCTSFSSELPKFLKSIADVDINAGLSSQLMGLISPLQVVFRMVIDEEADEDGVAKKISALLIATISQLVSKLPVEDGKATIVLDWLRELARNKMVEPTVAIAIIQLMVTIEESVEEYGKIVNHISAQLCEKLGTVIESELCVDEVFTILTDFSALQVHSAVCTALKHKLENTSWLLGRLKAEQVLSTTYGQEEIKTKERSLCCQLNYIVKTLETLANASIKAGANADAVFKNLQHVYSILSALTKYFHGKSTAQNPAFQSVKFIPVVQLAGKRLFTAFDHLILHIEENENSKASKSANVFAEGNKILKETKIIPKVMYEIEQLEKNLLLLGKKTDIALEDYVKSRSIRFYRINKEKLSEELAKLDVSMLMTQGSANNATNVEETCEETSRGSDAENEMPPPPPKARKKSKRHS